MFSKTQPKYSSGVTLLECLVSLFIAMCIFVWLSKLFFTAIQSYQLQRDLYILSNRAEKVFSLLNTVLKHAGYIGCAKLTNTFPLKSYKNISLNTNNKIITDKQSIRVRSMEFPNGVVQQNSSDRDGIKILFSKHYYPGDILLISDCTQAEIIEVKKSFYQKKVQVIIPKEKLHFNFQKNEKNQKNVEIGKIFDTTLFIGKIKNKDSSILKNGLFVRHNNHTELLVDNVTQFNVIKTIKKDGITIEVHFVIQVGKLKQHYNYFIRA